MDEEFRKMLSDSLKEISLNLNDRQAEQFETFYGDLVEANKNINLTSITRKGRSDQTFPDSLEIILLSDCRDNDKIIDVGTGAGFPVFMAILWPN